MGGSSPKACEFLLQERVVLHTLLLAFQPPHVALKPRVVAFGCEARERLRAKVVHRSLLGAPQKHPRLPVLGLLVAMLTVCQTLKLSACFGIRDGLVCIFKGAPAPMRQGLRLAHEDFLCHLRDALILLHAVLLPKGLIPPCRSMGVACCLGSLGYLL